MDNIKIGRVFFVRLQRNVYGARDIPLQDIWVGVFQIIRVVERKNAVIARRQVLDREVSVRARKGSSHSAPRAAFGKQDN